jgi:hypothetical protein
MTNEIGDDPDICGYRLPTPQGEMKKKCPCGHHQWSWTCRATPPPTEREKDDARDTRLDSGVRTAPGGTPGDDSRGDLGDAGVAPTPQGEIAGLVERLRKMGTLFARKDRAVLATILGEAASALEQLQIELNASVRAEIKAQARIAELEKDVTIHGCVCIALGEDYNDALKRIERLEGALREIADYMPEHGAPSVIAIARAALKEQ